MELLKYINSNFDNMIPAYSYLDMHGKVREHITEEHARSYESTTSKKLSVEETIDLLEKVRVFIHSESLELVNTILLNKDWLKKITFVNDQSYRIIGFSIHRNNIVWSIDWYAALNHFNYFENEFFDSITNEYRYSLFDRAEQIFISFNIFESYLLSSSKSIVETVLGDYYKSIIK